MSGQSIVDRLNAAKHTVAGSALGRAVVKATTEEIMGPKRKHLEYLLACTSEINVSIPQMADLLIERTQNTSWVVTYKSLITIHHLMCYGNERFSQYMASHNSKFVLNNFMDKTGVQGIDMSSYIRKYAHYLNEKRETYKLMGFDFCKVKRGKEDGILRTMNAEKLVKTLPILQKQLDALVQFDIAANELTNGVINSSFCLLSKDLIRLFACYNDGIINLLEKFFDMNKKMCKEALDIYKKFLERTDSVSAFLKVAESSGIDKSDIPDLAKAPNSLLEALEAHVNGPDHKNKTNSATNVISSVNNNTKSSVNSAINSLNNNSSALLSAEEKRRVLEEEAKTLESFKASNNSGQAFEQNHHQNQASLTSPTNENPFGTNGTNGHTVPKPTSNQDDLFGLDLTNSSAQMPVQQQLPQQQVTNGTGSASDDLLMLSGANPFIQKMVNQQQYSQQPINPFQSNGMMSQPPMGGTNQMNLFQQQPQQPQQPQANQQAVFGNNSMMNPNQNTLANDLFGGLTFPSSSPSTTPMQPTSEFDAFGDVMQPTSNIMQPMSASMGQQAKPVANTNGSAIQISSEQKILSTDLESSLASLADNLDINRKNNNNFQKNHQWNSNAQQSQVKTGGQNWNVKQTAMTNAAPALNSPMNNGGWGNQMPATNSNAFNPFAAAIQPTNPMVPVQPTAQQVQSSNPFDLF